MYRAGIWGIAVAATVTWFAADAAAETTFVQGATRPGHTTFQVMTGYANIINREVPEVTVTVQQSGASVATTQLVESNRIQAGPVGNNAPYDAWRGLGKFEGKKTENIRTWTPIYTYGAQLIVPADSDIHDWTDLEGKRVGVGAVGSGGEMTNRLILETVGVGYDKIDEYQIGHGEMVDGFKNGSLDAIIETTGMPTAGVVELNTTRDIRIVPLTEAQIAAVSAKSELVSGGIVPAGTYEGIEKDIPIIVGYTINLIHKDIEDDLVYTMTKAIWENTEELGNVHPSQRSLNPEWIELGLLPIAPLHPGAERYYREQGWIN
ncbi:MAG: TAXI family TRAP transporter solute-binding subunit [Hyphomicrobiales bacterium]|nr:TAXI family TRAP transporter solute-binding subunit [Hyphomicrobiales bacterium]